ncbi:MAG: UDP-N-acetylglucosamine 2-epimerase [Proteobacteria bacterium]|nr:UDP-N-acetylglucosamine 2-epimerase [Pseudomonadota bacterium]
MKSSEVNPVQKKKILFVAYGGGHVNLVSPIIQKFLLVDDYEVTVLGLTTARFVLEKQGLSFLTFKDLLLESDARALEVGQSLANELVESKIPYDESVAYLGLSYYDLEFRLGVEKAAEMYSQSGRHAFLPLSILERLFEKIKPDLLVTTNSPRAEKAAILIAKERNIPSICIVDLYVLGHDKWLAKPGYANKLCVQNATMYDSLVSCGRDPNDIVITGNPAFDKLKDPKLTKSGQEYRAQKKWHDKKVILWASQPEPLFHYRTQEISKYPELPALTAKRLKKIALRHPEWHIIFRPHPSEKVNYGELPENITLSDDMDDLYILLSAADLIITSTSTVGQEALYLGKRLVTIDLSVYTPDLFYSALGFSTGVSDLENLESVLIETIYNPPKIVDLPPVGEATSKVEAVIQELLM